MRGARLRLWKGARGAARGDGLGHTRLLPGGECKAAQRAVTEDVDGRVVDKQRDRDPCEEGEHGRSPPAANPKPGEAADREQAEEGHVRSRGGAVPRDAEAPVEVVEERARATADSVG